MAFSMPYKNSIKPINNWRNLLFGEPKDIEVVENKNLFRSAPPRRLKKANSSAVYDFISQVVENHIFKDCMQRVRYRFTESANWVSLELKSGLLFGQGEYDLTNEAVALADPSPLIFLKCTHQ